MSVPLTVHLSSSSPEAVTFQLENENLRQQAEDDDPDDWNHLFNEIGHIDAITLPAHGEQTIFLSFRPQLRGDGRRAIAVCVAHALRVSQYVYVGIAAAAWGWAAAAC